MQNRFLRRLALLASLLILTGIVYATLSPIADRPRLSIGVDQERFLAFAALGVCLALASPRRLLWIALVTIAFAGALEWFQTLTDTRHGEPHDFLVKAAGAGLGVCATGVGLMLRRRFAWAGRPRP